MRVIGVDGCRGGWLAAVLAEDNSVAWMWEPTIAEVLASTADAIAIDIPIGLPDAGNRACDVQARRRLGRRGASVFAAPVRPVMRCATYAEARNVLAGLGGASMSAQAFGILRAVRDVDDLVMPADEHRVIEVHPELVLRLLAGTDLPPKRTPEGHALRRQALRGQLADIDELVASAPRPAKPDDAADALACALGARRWLRGEAQVLGDGSRDARGLAMRIVF